MKIMPRASRIATACSLLALSVTPSLAQDIPATIPLDLSCARRLGTPYCETTVIGTYTTTTIQPPSYDTDGILSAQYQVDFDGTLQVQGLPTTEFTFPVAPLLYLRAGDVGADVTTSLLMDLHLDYNFAGIARAVEPTSYTVQSLEVHAINVNLENREFETDNGDDGTFSLRAIDPSAITGNSTELSGSFQTTGSAIVFGTLSGTATLVPEPGIINVAGDLGNYLSPFALELDVAQTITTQLDETGLVTPAIAVTDGIEMNGSRVTGLGAGVAPTDAVNVAQLTAEAQARAAGDAALQTNLNAEQQARIAADLQLSGDIAVEAASRAQADTLLNQRIANEEAARADLATALTTEAATRAAADLSLGNQIGALDTRVDALESRIDRIEGKIDGSTAVAVAMSGNAFLPGMKFNLTGNVATYGGAQAGALQMGAMISDNVAVNAGVAHGFNKGGKTAGRVGFTIGW